LSTGNFGRPPNGMLRHFGRKMEGGTRKYWPFLSERTVADHRVLAGLKKNHIADAPAKGFRHLWLNTGPTIAYVLRKYVFQIDDNFLIRD